VTAYQYWTEVNILHVSPYEDNSRLDPDGDGIPTVWEWKRGYNPFKWDDHNNLDPDEDGVPTAWEWRWGYDPLTWDDHKHLDPDIDGIENIEEYIRQGDRAVMLYVFQQLREEADAHQIARETWPAKS
jgi:hypothetical protein